MRDCIVLLVVQPTNSDPRYLTRGVHLGSTHRQTIHLRRMDSNQFITCKRIPSPVEKNIKGKREIDSYNKSIAGQGK